MPSSRAGRAPKRPARLVDQPGFYDTPRRHSARGTTPPTTAPPTAHRPSTRMQCPPSASSERRCSRERPPTRTRPSRPSSSRCDRATRASTSGSWRITPPAIHQRARAAHAARGLPPRRPRAPAAGRVNVTSFQAVCSIGRTSLGDVLQREGGDNRIIQWQCAHATERSRWEKKKSRCATAQGGSSRARARDELRLVLACVGWRGAAVAGGRHVPEARPDRHAPRTHTYIPRCPRRASTSRCGVLSVSKRDLWSWKGRYGILRCGWSV